jgi:hypothetical protein
MPKHELVLVLDRLDINSGGGLTARAEVRHVRIDAESVSIVRTCSMSVSISATDADLEDLDWYLEESPRWPPSVVAGRVERSELKLSAQARGLFESTLGQGDAMEIIQELAALPCCDVLRVGVVIGVSGEAGSGSGATPESRQARVLAASVPWELLTVPIEARLSGTIQVLLYRRHSLEDASRGFESEAHLRALVVTARPDDDACTLLEHRGVMSAATSAATLPGASMTVQMLRQPTRTALLQELQVASESGEVYHLVHFDCHGFFDDEEQWGGALPRAPRRSAGDSGTTP